MKYPIPSRVPLPTFRPDMPMVPQQFPAAPQPMQPQMAQQGQQGNRFMNALSQNPEVFLSLGAGLLGGRTGPEQWSGGLGAMAQTMGAAKDKTETAKKANQTRAALEKMGADPQLLSLAETGAISWGDAYKYHREAMTPKNDLPNAYQEWQLAKQGGYEGSFFDWKKSSSGGTTVNVGDGAPGLGKLSTDYGYKLGPDGKPMVGPDGLPMAAPIPGSPAALAIEADSQKGAVQQSARDVSSRTITTAAQRAREAAKNRALGPIGQGIVGAINPYSDSAEVQRQVDVLKSNAKIENLTAMRAASPTGGALGAVSDKESEMLAAKSGALDPSSPTFERDLNDYELTLLQIVHGAEAGLQIYNATRAGSVPMGQEGSAGINGLLDKYAPKTQ